MLPNDLIDGQQIFVNLDGYLMVEHFNTSDLLLDDITMFKVSRLAVEESSADSDSDESYDDVEYVKRIPDEVSEERKYIKGEWVMDGSFLMGCILDDTFYYVINGDETYMRKKDLRAPESDPVVAMDLPGRLSDMKLADGTLCAVTWSKKVYALERDGTWKVILNSPHFHEFQDLTTGPDGQLLVLLRNGDDLAVMHGQRLVKTVENVRPHKCRFLPGSRGNVVVGLFFGPRENPRVMLNCFELSSRIPLARHFPWYEIVGCGSTNSTSVTVSDWAVVIRASSPLGRGMYATMDELENAREDAENGVRVGEPTTRYNSAIAVVQLVHTTSTY
ncbi:hypothetical protein FOZ61_008334 [Perkinsus olseni]|uniref:Uncharacterized protein n=1 Tax=Perkinsus olseni TaxID=32597 RepID=A0A7J6L561_PEROL|nr:hypothetical protein FOZ61_008334 [Perkinsus olseni]